MWTCNSCEKEECKNCTDKWKCNCKCNQGRVADVVKKGCASILGIGMAVGGVSLSFATGGLAIPIGGVLLGIFKFKSS